MFLINHQYFQSYAAFFVKIFTHYEKDLKRTVTMPLHQAYCLKYISGCLTFYCPKETGSQVIGALKSSISRDKMSC